MIPRFEILEIGPAPHEEECAQLGDADYGERGPEECRRFIAAIRGKLGQEPAGARLFVRPNRHDFGTYYEVAVRFDAGDRVAEEWAWRVLDEAPARWPQEGGHGL